MVVGKLGPDSLGDNRRDAARLVGRAFNLDDESVRALEGGLADAHDPHFHVDPAELVAPHNAPIKVLNFTVTMKLDNDIAPRLGRLSEHFRCTGEATVDLGLSAEQAALAVKMLTDRAMAALGLRFCRDCRKLCASLGTGGRCKQCRRLAWRRRAK